VIAVLPRIVDCLTELHELRLLTLNEVLSPPEVGYICEAAHMLEHLGIGGLLVAGADLRHISQLTQLKSFQTMSCSSFTSLGFLEFLEELNEHPHGSHDGLDNKIRNQFLALSKAEHEILRERVEDWFKGKFEMSESVLTAQ